MPVGLEVQIPMFDSIEEAFAGIAPTPKGRKALRAIFRATHQIVMDKGMHGASLDAIASRAGLSQAALRYYFPTREELLTTFFVAATQWMQTQMAGRLADTGQSPRDTLASCLAWHLEYMEAVDTAAWLESSAYWLRRKPRRNTRDQWYRWLAGQYALLIERMRPDIGRGESRRRAFAMLTLILGAWITHGRGSAVDRSLPAAARRQLLVDTALAIATR